MLRDDDRDRTRVAYINLNKFQNDSPQKKLEILIEIVCRLRAATI